MVVGSWWNSGCRIAREVVEVWRKADQWSGIMEGEELQIVLMGTGSKVRANLTEKNSAREETMKNDKERNSGRGGGVGR